MELGNAIFKYNYFDNVHLFLRHVRFAVRLYLRKSVMCLAYCAFFSYIATEAEIISYSVSQPTEVQPFYTKIRAQCLAPLHMYLT